MKQGRILDYIVILATCVMQLVVGASLRGIGRVYSEVYKRLDSGELPSITESVILYTSSPLPFVAGAILATLSGVGLAFVVSSDRFRPFFTFAMVISWMFGLMHLAHCWVGLTMGLILGVNQQQ